MFGLDGVDVTRANKHAVETSMLKDLSSAILPAVLKSFLDPPGALRAYILSPALRQDIDGSVFIIARIDTRLPKNNPHLNRFFATYFWQFRLNSTLDVMDTGTQSGPINPVNFGPFGPLEPRLFEFQRRRYIAYGILGLFFIPSVLVVSCVVFCSFLAHGVTWIFSPFLLFPTPLFLLFSLQT